MVVSAALRLASAGSAPEESHEPLVIAHRGGTGGPENSLAAFEAAIAAGADMVELDVRLTRDSVVVVFHDATARGIPLSRLTYAQLCERRSAVTTLDAAAALCRDRIAVDIEVKSPGSEAAVLEVVRRRLQPDQVVLTSFHEGAVAALKRAEPTLVCGLLLTPARLRAIARRIGPDPIGWVRRIGADFVLPHQLLVPLGRGSAKAEGRPGLLGLAARDGMPLVVWTVNRPERLARYLAEPRIAGVITDTPEVALSARRTAASRREGVHPPSVTRRTRRALLRLVRPEHVE